MWHLGWSEGAWSEGDESPVVVASGTSTVSGVGASVAEAAGAAAGTSAAAALSPPGIALGKARVRQKVYHDPLETDDQGGSLTTWATDLTVSSVSSGSDTLTFAADQVHVGPVMEEVSALVEGLAAYPRVVARVRDTLELAEREKPDIAVLIDKIEIDGVARTREEI